MNKISQKEKIKKHLESGQTITALDALDLFGCFRLASRISDLKQDGMNIKSKPYHTSGGAIISRYYFDKDMRDKMLF